MKQSLTLDTIRLRSMICGDCWEYRTEAKTEHHRRHPQVKHDGEHWLVRKLAYEMANGPVRHWLRVVPDCDNPYCINPAHQKTLTESQNGKRAAANGSFSRPARGKKIAETRRKTVAKLTAEQAMEIRMSDECGPVLAERFGINKSRVNAIKRGEAWKDYSNPFAGLGA